MHASLQICVAIDSALSTAVTFRRRDFEAESMMQELCRRSGICLPSPTQGIQLHKACLAKQGHHLTRIFIICNLESASDMVSSISSEIMRATHVAVSTCPPDSGSVPTELDVAGKLGNSLTPACSCGLHVCCCLLRHKMRRQVLV